MNPTKNKFKIGDKFKLSPSYVRASADVTNGRIYAIHHGNSNGSWYFVDDVGDDHGINECDMILVEGNNVVADTILSKISELENRLKAIDTERETVIKNISKLQDALEILS